MRVGQDGILRGGCQPPLFDFKWSRDQRECPWACGSDGWWRELQLAATASAVVSNGPHHPVLNLAIP